MTPQQWLQTPSKQRTLLAKVSYLNNGLKTAYLSTAPFVSLPTDNPANQPFDDFIIEPPKFSRRMGIFSSKSSASFSALPLFAHALLTDLANANVYKQQVDYLIGDNEWPLADFIAIGSQLAERVMPSGDEITVEMRDPSIKLDKLIDTGTFTSGANTGKAKPLCIGDVFNIEPVLENVATHKYRVHYDSVNDITEVRDNGISVTYTKTNADGSFLLNQAPVGRITCDVQGAKPVTYLQYPGDVINWLLTTFVGEVNIADLSVLPNYTLGIYQREPNTVRATIDLICKSINGYHFYSRTAQFVAAIFANTTGITSVLLTLDDVEADGVRLRQSIEPANKVVVNYRQNFTPQSDGLAGGVSATNRDLFSKEYQTADADNVLPDYPEAQPININTCLVNGVDATSVATAKAAIASIKRNVYEVQALAAPFTFELGQEIKLTYWDFGFKNGQTGIVIALGDNPIDGEVTVELWR